jgi:hypothetical protein
VGLLDFRDLQDIPDFSERKAYLESMGNEEGTDRQVNAEEMNKT